MEMELIEKLVLGKKITRKKIETELYEICDREHVYCSDGNCIIHQLNDGCVNPGENNRGCACFKNGKKMYDFIVNHHQ